MNYQMKSVIHINIWVQWKSPLIYFYCCLKFPVEGSIFIFLLNMLKIWLFKLSKYVFLSNPHKLKQLLNFLQLFKHIQPKKNTNLPNLTKKENKVKIFVGLLWYFSDFFNTFYFLHQMWLRKILLPINTYIITWLIKKTYIQKCFNVIIQ